MLILLQNCIKNCKFARNFLIFKMLIFDKKQDLQKHLEPFLEAETSIGFVPTMGALHAGHLSLLQQAIDNNTITVISIFVNPTQFNNPDDLKKYPRTLESDVEKIKTISDKFIVYAPTVDDIYEGLTISKSFDYDGIENQMEGKHRPGHFNGVGTIVKLLFEIVKPTNSYFGEKDFQQLQIVKKLVSKYKIPVNIVGCPIFRESNGLAMSSRNERLTADERAKANIIFETLQEAKSKFNDKSVPLNAVNHWVEKTFEKNKDFKLEYFEIADEATLLPCLKRSYKKNFRAFIAIFVRDIRLIDTISLE
jgi:pantoate--beta-alanine ligase